MKVVLNNIIKYGALYISLFVCALITLKILEFIGMEFEKIGNTAFYSSFLAFAFLIIIERYKLLEK